MVTFSTPPPNGRSNTDTRPPLQGRRGSSFRRSEPPTKFGLMKLIDAYQKSNATFGQPISERNPLRLLIEEDKGSLATRDEGKEETCLAPEKLRIALVDALKWCIVRFDTSLLSWLTDIKGDVGRLLDEVVPAIRDDDNHTLINMAILASAGNEKKEIHIRMLVNRWGVLWPIKNVYDKDGNPIPAHSWSPLHLASLLCTPPTVSFLLTKGCNPAWVTNKGLKALDLVDGMTHREEVIELLTGVGDAAAIVTPNPNKSSPELNQTGMSLQDEMTDKLLSTPQSAYSPSFSITTEEANDEAQRETAVRAKRSEALDRYRRLKRLAKERRLQRERRREEEEQVDLAVRMRLLNFGMGEDDANYLMKGYERRWGTGAGSIGRHHTPMDEDSSSSEEDEADANDSDMDDNDRFPSLSEEHLSRSEDAQTGGSSHGGSDDEETNRGDETLQTPRRPTNRSNIDDSTFLVFDPEHIESILEVLVFSYQPQCYPLEKRTLPANIFFLLTRYAVYRCGDQEDAVVTLLDGLGNSVIELSQAATLPTLAFWTYNTTILIYLLQSDQGMKNVCEDNGTLTFLRDTLDSLQAHITRALEIGIDAILEPAMLDCETIDEDVRFDDEWSILKSLTGRRKNRLSAPHVASIFGATPGSPIASSSRMQSSPSSRSSARGSLILDTQLDKTPSKSNGSGADVPVSPANIIDLLSGMLMILELYEINPALIIQIFSQVFCWLGAVMFNLIINSGKKYLCRSKALQIKMNLELVAEWVKNSSLPSTIYTKHFERVLQLLQWLQCSSQLTDFDMFIATTSQLQALNPLQLRRAIRDYRHEVGEPRISEECSQYLSQLVKDWDRKRIQEGVGNAQKEVQEQQQGSMQNTIGQLPDLDALFDVDIGLADYHPVAAPPSTEDTQDTRYIIPMTLPSQQYLTACPTSRVSSAFQSATGNSDGRASSPTSYSSARPMAYTVRTKRRLTKLPEGFVSWFSMSEKAANIRLRASAAQYQPPRQALGEIHLNEKANGGQGPPVPNKTRTVPSPYATTQTQDVYANPKQTGSPVTPTFQQYRDPYEARRIASPSSPTRSPTTARRSWLPGFSMRRTSNMSRADSEDGSVDDAETPMADPSRTLWGR